MRLLPVCAPRWGAVLLVGALISACGSTGGAPGVLEALTPYKVTVVQGNVVTREQVAVLRSGMSRIQVREILGTPLLTSVFHGERWDYVFTLRRQGVMTQSRRVSIFFKDGVLAHFEADELPSEAEFVASLDGRAPTGDGRELEATPEALEKFPQPQPKPQVALPPLPTSYPPLEPANR